MTARRIATVPPLRQVVIHDFNYASRTGGLEWLACGHSTHLSVGFSYAERRRCRKCLAGEPPERTPGALKRGVYDTTLAFSTIPQHVCVADAMTEQVIAVTGPAGDRDAERFADLFAAAPALLEAAERTANVLRAVLNGSRSDTVFQELADAADALDKAIRQSRPLAAAPAAPAPAD